jgi:archaemetzincin
VHSWLLLFFLLGLSACSASIENAANTAAPPRDEKADELRSMIPKLERFFSPMGKPAPYDWLGAHKEPGQTFEEYLQSEPMRPAAERRTLYILPLGDFTLRQKKAVDLAADYLAAFYGLRVKRLPPKVLPTAAKSFRQNKLLNRKQYQTGYILQEILLPSLPSDAAALIAFTAEDLFSDEKMSFVFGQASFSQRVGVWSLNRLGERAAEGVFLRRTLKIAAHETGHLFSIRHCTKYECLMSGTNHLAETDRRPIDACPECTAKILWSNALEPADRYKDLSEFARRAGLRAEAAEFTAKAAVVGGSKR